MSHTAFKFAAQVGASGKLEIAVPVPAGTPVEVLVIAQAVAEALPLEQAPEDLFAEMAPFTVCQPDADDSRAAIYCQREGE